MVAVKKPQHTDGTLAEAVRQLESRFIVGRRAECTLFLRYLTEEAGPERIFNVFGPGGAGKTCLLDEFGRLAEKNGALFLSFDSRDIPRPPDPLAEEVLATLKESAHQGRRLVLALDTYEEMGDLDRWLRERFLPRLPSGVLILIAGRHPLMGAWRTSPAWHRMVKPMPLEDFDLHLARKYLAGLGIHDETVIRDIWDFTRGHPLALSLAASLVLQGSPAGLNTQQKAEAVQELARYWLSEVPDEGLRGLVEAAASVRRFDQEILSHVVAGPVAAADFDRLTSLSFVRLGRRGWALHDLVRSVIAHEFHRRAPVRYKTFWQQSLSWYRQKIFTASTEQERCLALAEFLYLLGDSLIRSIYFADVSDEGLYIEPAGPGGLPALKEYFARLIAKGREDPRDVRWDFHDPETDTHYTQVFPAEHYWADLEMVDLDQLLDLEPSAVHLCKNSAGRILGFDIMIPVTRRTFDYLCSQPVTGPYFRSLTPAQRAEYAGPEDAPAAWFIRYMHVQDPADLAARTALLRDTLSVIGHDARILSSSPIDFHQHVLRHLGFQEVPGATHYDYGPDNPSPTFLLDLRGPRLAAFVDRLTESAGAALSPAGAALSPAEGTVFPAGAEVSLALPAGSFGLTAREREVAELVLAGLSNAEIASRLVIGTVTVKKHLSQVFDKTEVASRAQLVQKLVSSSRF